MGSLEHTFVYATAETEISSEYLKSKVEEKTLEEFAHKARLELEESYTGNRSPEDHRLQVPETTRFIFFRRDGDLFREAVSFMGGERITSRTEVSFRVDQIREGRGPITDAVATKKPVVVSYTVRYDECENSLDNAYWRQTQTRFPDAPVQALHDELAMHPSSIIAIPLMDPQTGSVSAVAMFDTLDTGVFNSGLAAEMSIRLGVLYGQLFAPPDPDSPRAVQL